MTLGVKQYAIHLECFCLKPRQVFHASLHQVANLVPTKRWWYSLVWKWTAGCGRHDHIIQTWSHCLLGNLEMVMKTVT